MTYAGLHQKHATAGGEGSKRSPKVPRLYVPIFDGGVRKPRRIFKIRKTHARQLPADL